MRYHICWGSWHGPHTTDIPLADIVDLVLQRQRRRLLDRGRQRRATSTNGASGRTTKLPEGKMLIPGVVSHATNVVEHRGWSRTASSASRTSSAARTWSPARTAASAAASTRRSPGRNWRALAEGARLATRELWR